MKLVTVEALFATESAAESVAVIKRHAPSVRDMDGCARYDLYTDPNDSGKVMILQRWDSLPHFDAYRRSEVFAWLGNDLKIMMTAPPVTTICDVDPL